MNPYLALLLVVVAFAMSAWMPGPLSALAWLVPLGLAVWFGVVWLDERQPPEQGDNQPGLVALVGVVVVLLTASAAALGHVARR
jgi:hypothetical protein